MSASSTNLKTAELVSVNQNVAQIMFQNHFQKVITGSGDRPAILVMVINNQTMSQSCISELAIVVGVASAAILNTLHIIVVVNHLVKE